MINSDREDETFLSGARPVYIAPRDDAAREVLIPALKEADQVDCMVGFFSSGGLRVLAPGLAEYIARGNSPMRLIISPYLHQEDLTIIRSSPADLPSELIERLLVSPPDEDLLTRHTLECIAWLLSEGRLRIKVALVKHGLFHPKVWLFRKGGCRACLQGSSNLTSQGLTANVENLILSRAWLDQSQEEIVDRLTRTFEEYWSGTLPEAVIHDLPEAIEKKIIRLYRGPSPPSSEGFLLAAHGHSVSSEPLTVPTDDAPVSFHVPPSLNYTSGSFAHQGLALQAWVRAGCRGTLEMATGSGKTIVGLLCAYECYKSEGRLLLVIAVPFIPLLRQWVDEAKRFSLRVRDLSNERTRERRKRTIREALRDLRLGVSTVEVIVLTHEALCTPEIIETIQPGDIPSLLIADEVHNLGRRSFIENPPQQFHYRLGLSATPVRQFDEEGTEALLAYFGPVCFSYSLEEAIGRSLVPYDYYLYNVTLLPEEMEEWIELTHRIKRLYAMLGDSPEELSRIPDRARPLLLRRRKLLEMASGKVNLLRGLIEEAGPRHLRHTLIYASDKGPSQLEAVNQVLSDLGVLFHQLTADETANTRLMNRLLDSFAAGKLQVLTAKRVLDEGVNIPQVRSAYILASTTVRRQWVQRRGRLLRGCEPIGKDHAVIHDFVVLPPDGHSEDSDARELVRFELDRVFEFARLARNAGEPAGPLASVTKLMRAAGLI